MTEGTWQPEPIIARMVTTRSVTLTTGQRVQFTREALDGIVRQISESFVPMNLEHLSFLAPIGRWKNAEVIQAPDGEFELYATGDTIPRLRPLGEDPDPLSVLPDLTELEPSEDLDFKMRIEFEPRNFEQPDHQDIVAEAPLPVRTQHRWAELPPIESRVSRLCRRVACPSPAQGGPGRRRAGLAGGERPGPDTLTWLASNLRGPLISEVFRADPSARAVKDSGEGHLPRSTWDVRHWDEGPRRLV